MAPELCAEASNARRPQRFDRRMSPSNLRGSRPGEKRCANPDRMMLDDFSDYVSHTLSTHTVVAIFQFTSTAVTGQ
jgi:hypothetical protein